MTARLAQTLRERLRAYGARAEDVVMLDTTAEPAQQIRYLDLIRPAGEIRSGPWPQAVVEVSGQPVLYIVDTASTPPSDWALPHLRRILAFRAGGDHLAWLEPGRMTIYPVAPTPTAEPPLEKKPDRPDAAGLIPSLAFPASSQRPDEIRRLAQSTSSATAVHKLLFDLLTRTTATLTDLGMHDLDALSLVGRALFIRFLVDRGVLYDQDVRTICGAETPECFGDAPRAARMSCWLDDTFNGDFLPLPQAGAASWFRDLPVQAYAELGNIVHRATPQGQLHLQWGSQWNDLLFDHIPVGLLSQVYEDHAHRVDAGQAKATSVRYTPRHIAEYMVDEVFFALGGEAPHARVLDPAVGGGVFLVAAFRRLAAERWQAERRPPDTRELRRILYEQLRGFDISEPALRLCSLGLYLTAIELDPNPRPFERLRFDQPLLGTVLHDVRAQNRCHGYIGSLSQDRIGQEHRGHYDVVIGNPPWSSWTKTKRSTQTDIDEQVAEVERVVGEIVHGRLGNDVPARYTMLDKVPDLPFVWRAMEWAKVGGQIALTLHGRLLFKQSDPGRQARNDLLRAFQVTGILNGTAVRDTDYWPEVRAPFCLLFACNVRPHRDASFLFVSPELELGLNQRGKLRIDDASARPVAVAELAARPTLLKTLFRGTVLDAGVLERIDRLRLPTLGQYWEHAGWKDYKGQGFQIGGDTRSKEVHDLWDLPVLQSRDQCTSCLVDAMGLTALAQGTRLHRARKRSIYEAPLVLIAKAQSSMHGAAFGAYLALKDVAYSESFFGFSCKQHPQGERLAKYLLLLLNSELYVYIALLRSSQFGVEREALHMEDLEQFPFRPLEQLPEALQASIEPLAQELIASGAGVLGHVDEWVSAVYGLSGWDQEVIADTLAVAPPFAHTRARGQARPTPGEVERYATRISEVIQPFLERRGRRVSVRLLRDEPMEPWIVFQIDTHTEPQDLPVRHDNTALSRLIAEADSLAASRLLVVSPPATLLVAVVAQYRYFTGTRARMLGLELVHEQAKVLLGEGQ